MIRKHPATMNSTLPDGVPALDWPHDTHGYRLSPGGKRYRRLTRVESHGLDAGESVFCFVEQTPDGDVYWCADGWRGPRRKYKVGEFEHFVPLFEAALAFERGEGPATYCDPRPVPIHPETGRAIREAVPASS